MTRSGVIFLIILILNALIAMVYLLLYLVFGKDETHRMKYVMHTVIMLLCPVVGIGYFLLACLKYHYLK